MSFIFLIMLLGLAIIHGLNHGKRTSTELAELLLVYVLVGYCGAYMFSAAILDLVASFRQETIFPFPAGGPIQQFFDIAFLGMSTIALLAVWFRGVSLVAPALGWSIFFIGATYIHLAEHSVSGGITLWIFLGVFSSHGLIALVLLTLLFVANSTIIRQMFSSHKR